MLHKPIDPRESPTDLSELVLKLAKSLGPYDVKVEFNQHPGYSERAVRLLGYSPAGTHQIILTKDTRWMSIIRGMVSFGSYEWMTNQGEWEKDPGRSATISGVVNVCKKFFK